MVTQAFVYCWPYCLLNYQVWSDVTPLHCIFPSLIPSHKGLWHHLHQMSHACSLHHVWAFWVQHCINHSCFIVLVHINENNQLITYLLPWAEGSLKDSQEGLVWVHVITFKFKVLLMLAIDSAGMWLGGVYWVVCHDDMYCMFLSPFTLFWAPSAQAHCVFSISKIRTTKSPYATLLAHTFPLSPSKVLMFIVCRHHPRCCLCLHYFL